MWHMLKFYKLTYFESNINVCVHLCIFIYIQLVKQLFGQTENTHASVFSFLTVIKIIPKLTFASNQLHQQFMTTHVVICISLIE